jgi:hypothetical protein
MSRNSCLFFALAISGLVFFGCSRAAGPNYKKLDLSQVHGKVTLDGQPLPQAHVRFYAKDGTLSYGMTDSEGRYSLMFNSEQPGVLKGPKTISILAADSVSSGAGAGEGADPDAKQRKVNRVPARYNTKSTLTETVDKPTHEFNFDLKSR